MTAETQIILGDCMDTLQSVPAGSVGLVIADLPFGITNASWDSRVDIAELIEHFESLMKPGAVAVMFAIQPFTTDLVNAWRSRFRYDLVWQKNGITGFLNANKMPLRSHETMLVFYDGSPRYRPQLRKGTPWRTGASKVTSKLYGSQQGFEKPLKSLGRLHPRSVLKFKHDRPRFHPTQKPVALLEWIIRSYSDEGDTVLDPTMGVGSTGVACHNTFRRFIGIERDERFFQVARRRIEDRGFMGQSTLEAPNDET